MGLHTSGAILLMHIIMRHFVEVGDEHLIGIQIQVEGNGADAVLGAWRTEVAQLGATRSLEMQFEAALGKDFPYLFYRSLWEIAF